jgi:hypothetical protein
MVRTHLEAARCLEVVLIGWLVGSLGTLVPPVGLGNPLVAMWTRMLLAVLLAMGRSAVRFRGGAVGLAGVLTTTVPPEITIATARARPNLSADMAVPSSFVIRRGDASRASPNETLEF